jgi:long-chain acyl-CoA synthetase
MYVAINRAAEKAKVDFSCIDTCVSGSAPLPLQVQEQFEELTGGKLVEGYGLSEASPVTHINPLGTTRKIGSIGLPVPDTDCKIVDPADPDRELAPGETGELAICGPQVMQGYWRASEETARVLRNGWLYTGDLARVDEDGFFYIVDRKKDMIIVGGFNVYPREVEEVLIEHPHVDDAVVVGVPDDYRGETVKAFVVPKDGATIDEKELQAFVRQRLAPYKVFRYLEVRHSMPRTAVGKVLRRLLREGKA